MKREFPNSPSWERFFFIKPLQFRRRGISVTLRREPTQKGRYAKYRTHEGSGSIIIKRNLSKEVYQKNNRYFDVSGLKYVTFWVSPFWVTRPGLGRIREKQYEQTINQPSNQPIIETIKQKNIEDIVALTPLQEGMLFHYLQNPGSPLYLEQLSLDISGPMDKGFFEAAWQEVARRNGALRTLFRWDKMEKPVQIVLKPSTKESAGSTVGSGGPKIRYVSFSPIGEDSERAGDKWVENIKAADREERFDLTASPFA